MKTEIAFWDTSAIIPLYCNQAISRESRRIRQQFKQPVLWWGTHVEMHSGILRLLREGILTKKQSKKALEKWESLLSVALIVKPDDKVLRLAVSMTGDYGLRALDAFQLAAALVWCREKPRNRPFVSADVRLADAASDAGFDAIVLS
ncbi:MAG: type II toxin-antitoxin system VapC family toxin [Pyrinomonadaceae bacterium]